MSHLDSQSTNKDMKLLVFLILSISTGLVLGEKLKCFECSEKAENNKKCSVNQTRYNEAPVDRGKSWNLFDFFFFFHLITSFLHHIFVIDIFW